jgi:hypothetical protein
MDPPDPDDASSQITAFASAGAAQDTQEFQTLSRIMRQLHREVTKLREQLDSAIKKHRSDAHKYQEETEILQAALQRLLEGETTPAPSPLEETRINELQSRLDGLLTSHHQIQRDCDDSARSNSVLDKEVQQYKLTLSALEDDLRSTESDREQIAKQKSKILSIEEDSRAKTRQITEFELSQRLKTIELEKVKQRIGAVKQQPILIVQRHPWLDLNEGSWRLQQTARDCSQKLEKHDSIPHILNFLKGIPKRYEILESESERLTNLLDQNRQKYEKLESETVTEKKGDVSPEKLKKLVGQLAESNSRKKAKLATLRDLAERQHGALRRCIGSGDAVPESLFVSLEQVIGQLVDCAPGERKGLGQIADRIIDAMAGI